ncbi:TetR/AcrR family transcriptional regulator [Amnibacterium endophyticum]|uniref:TetR/AcrR family transcriptional regulator n=1 Tax=Amnibacterium endophyticum TaxID=2109337 RepID=A0ABW4LIA8_9MICO
MPTTSRTELRARIVYVAAALLADQGAGALTTRRVADAAGVQAPTIYRLFGDKDGLLEAVAEHAMATQAAAKARIASDAAESGVDPLEDLEEGWRTQIEFGVGNPGVFRLLSDPDRVRGSAAARAGREVLVARVRRLAEAGLLRVGEDRAVDLVQAAGIGVIQTLLATPVEHRDPGLSDAMYRGVLAQILIEAPASAEGDPVAAAAVTLRAAAPRLLALTSAERDLLVEWLDRIVQQG